jgi:hypothetical protein
MQTRVEAFAVHRTGNMAAAAQPALRRRHLVAVFPFLPATLVAHNPVISY